MQFSVTARMAAREKKRALDDELPGPEGDKRRRTSANSLTGPARPRSVLTGRRMGGLNGTARPQTSTGPVNPQMLRAGLHQQGTAVHEKASGSTSAPAGQHRFKAVASMSAATSQVPALSDVGMRVRLLDLKVNSDLNGYSGVLERFDAQIGHWIVRIYNPPPTLPSGVMSVMPANLALCDAGGNLVRHQSGAPAESALRPGMTVRINDSEAGPVYSGKLGICERWHAAKQRWIVRVFLEGSQDGPSRLAFFRPESLLPEAVGSVKPEGSRGGAASSRRARPTPRRAARG